MKLLWLLAGLGLLQSCLAANILTLLPFPAKSHGILIERLMTELADRGHSVTFLTGQRPQKDLPKIKILEIPNLWNKLMNDMKEQTGNHNMLDMRHQSPWLNMFIIPMIGMKVCQYALEEEIVKNLINSNEKFDLVMGEIFADESVLAGFAHKFNAPLVAVQPFMPNIWGNYLVGNPAPTAFIPDPMLGYSNRMCFFQRVNNFLYGLVGELYHTMYYLPKQDKIMREHFGEDLPPIHDLVKKTSLVLVNHHYSLGFPRPYVPNMVEVAGMHIGAPKALPQELKTYMDNSKNGVILFSMGSNLKSSEMAPELIQSILKAFGKMKQNILWKFEVDLPNMPKNVKIMSWLPQSDILAHPNLKLFITHGGLLSTTEAVHRGVPVVGIPIFGDQPANMRHTENSGFGKTLLYDDITEDTLYDSVMEVLNNPRYREVAQAKSTLLRDNPMPPLDTAVWWIEYVLRHKGAPHLRSAAQDLAWYQIYLLDVYALGAVILLVSAYVNFFIMRAIFRKICSKTCKSKKDTSNQKKKQ